MLTSAFLTSTWFRYYLVRGTSATEDDHQCVEKATCAAGEYMAAASTGECQKCAAGTVDHDSATSGPATACVDCVVGKYAAEGSCVTDGQCTDFNGCVACAVGYADVDETPGTECELCAVGKFAAGDTGGAGACIACVAGTADTDSSAATACQDRKSVV